jgi:hypothetical protein
MVRLPTIYLSLIRGIHSIKLQSHSVMSMHFNVFTIFNNMQGLLIAGPMISMYSRDRVDPLLYNLR